FGGEIEAGLVDRLPDLLVGEGRGAGHGDRTCGEVHVDLLDTDDFADLSGDRVDAVLAVHAGDGVSGGGVGHGSLLIRTPTPYTPRGYEATPLEGMKQRGASVRFTAGRCRGSHRRPAAHAICHDPSPWPGPSMNRRVRLTATTRPGRNCPIRPLSL